tara:strand:+ start:223 stop:495 length:273 start_codon:yes stop_codon:yes gene_type:complete
MKSFLLLLIPFLFLMTLFGAMGTIDQAGEREFGIWLTVFIFSFALLIPSYFKYMQTEDDFLFLWVKTKSKRLRERKDSAKEAMRKELEED